MRRGLLTPMSRFGTHTDDLFSKASMVPALGRVLMMVVLLALNWRNCDSGVGFETVELSDIHYFGSG